MPTILPALFLLGLGLPSAGAGELTLHASVNMGLDPRLLQLAPPWGRLDLDWAPQGKAWMAARLLAVLPGASEEPGHHPLALVLVGWAPGRPRLGAGVGALHLPEAAWLTSRSDGVFMEEDYWAWTQDQRARPAVAAELGWAGQRAWVRLRTLGLLLATAEWALTTDPCEDTGGYGWSGYSCYTVTQGRRWFLGGLQAEGGVGLGDHWRLSAELDLPNPRATWGRLAWSGGLSAGREVGRGLAPELGLGFFDQPGEQEYLRGVVLRAGLGWGSRGAEDAQAVGGPSDVPVGS